MKTTLIFVVLFTSLLLNVCFGKTLTVDDDAVEEQQIVVDTVPENDASESTKSESVEEEFPYTRLNLDDTKPVTGVYPIDYKGKYALIDSNGKITAAKYFIYTHMYYNNYLGLDDDYSSVAYKIPDDETEAYDFFGDKLAPSKYVFVYLDRGGNEAFGYFIYATPFSEGVAIVKDVSGTYHAMNKDGEIIASLDNIYSDNTNYKIADVGEFHDGRARFCIYDNDDKFYGFLDKEFDIVIEPKYTFARKFSEGLALVSDGELTGYIDPNGELKIDLSSVDGCEPESGFLPYYFPAQQYDGWDFSDGLAYVCLPRDYEKCPVDNLGFFYWEQDENGNVIYDRDHYASLPYGYYIDKNGNMVLEDVIGSKFVHGLAAARDPETGKVGYIDKTGKFVIEPQFTLAYPFNESGIAMVSNGEGSEFSSEPRVGYINTKGEIVIPMEYSGIHLPPFDFESCGIVGLPKYTALRSGTMYYFDKNGTILGTIPFSY